MCHYYADHPDGQAFVDCLVAADQEAGACVASAACDESGLDACFEAYGQDNEACPRPSDEILEGLSAACPPG